MNAAYPLPAWVVLDDYVEVCQSPAAPAREWAIVECASRTAYGCGEHGQKLLDGLALHARLVTPWLQPDLSTALYIQANDGARRALGAEFGEADGGAVLRIDDDRLSAKAFVEAADEDHVVLTLVFRHYESRRRVCYYLIYNAADASLAMVPCAPDGNPITTTMTRRPLVARRDGGGGYELVVLSQRRVPSTEEEVFSSTLEDVLCVWTPPAAAKEDVDVDEQPWRVHRWRYPAEVQHPFSAEVMFAFQGKAFFVDLSLGILYCDLPAAAAAAAADGAAVEFHFIPLPQAIPVDLKWDKIKPEDQGALYPDRTMRCVEGSIKLVCIDRTPPRRYGDAELTVWALDPDLSRKQQWQRERGFPVRDIWRLRSFRDPHGLPFMEPKCLVLMRDGTLCLLVPNKCMTREDSIDDFICSLDLNSMSILWSGRLRGYRYEEPAIFPSDFFRRLCPLVPRKSNLLSNICIDDGEDFF